MGEKSLVKLKTELTLWLIEGRSLHFPNWMKQHHDISSVSQKLGTKERNNMIRDIQTKEHNLRFSQKYWVLKKWDWTNEGQKMKKGGQSTCLPKSSYLFKNFIAKKVRLNKGGESTCLQRSSYPPNCQKITANKIAKKWDWTKGSIHLLAKVFLSSSHSTWGVSSSVYCTER